MKRFNFLPTYYYTDITGTSELTLEKSAGKPLRSFKICGNSVQDGTPSPDNPIEVVSVGDFSEVLGTMSDRHIGLGGVSYSSDGFTEPKILLEPNTTYYLRFDYVINSTNQTLYTGIGYGSTGYQYDIKYNAKYPSQEIGVSSTFECSFTTPSKFSVSTPYLALRLVRTLEVAYFNVDISNIYVTKEPYGYKIPITAREKNLFNSGSISANTAILADGTISPNDNFMVSGFIDVLPNVTYSMVFQNPQHDFGWWNLRIHAYDKDKNWISNIAVERIEEYGKNEITFTVENSCNFVRISMFNQSTDIQVTSDIYTITTNIYLDEPLRKVGNYADYIDFENSKVVRRVYKRAFKGTEDWSGPWASSVTDKGAGFYLYFNRFTTKSIKKGTDTTYGLCNYGIYTSYMALSPTQANLLGRFWVHTGGYLAYHAPCTTLADLKAWLAEKDTEGNPFCVYFVLQNKEEEDVDLRNLPTFKGTTIYEVGTSIEPSQTEAQYYKN